MDSLTKERIESIKAGTIGALSLSLAFAIATFGNHLVLAHLFQEFASLGSTRAIDLLVSGAIACMSGFLFGITYRYIIRDDRNSHLQEGAVLAFGLVRGLAQVDVGLKVENAFWSLGVLCAESILLFAIARFTLDLAIDRRWVKPFKSS